MDNSAGASSHAEAALARSRPDGAGVRQARPSRPVGKSASVGTFAEGERRSVGHEQLSQIQRARIVAAVIDVASQHGVGYATVARVVARSGVSRRTFYAHFLDREDCFLAGFDQSFERIAAVVALAYREPAKWSERVRHGLAALLQFFDREPALARLVVVEAFGAGPRVLERRRLGIAQVIAVVDREGRATKPGAGPPPLTGEGVVGGALSLIHARLAFPEPATQLEGSPRPNGSSAARSPGASSGSGAVALLVELLNPLLALILSPYLGPAAARRELDRPMPSVGELPGAEPLSFDGGQAGDPLRDLDMRLTYRTVRVLLAIGELAQPGAHPSNRQVAEAADISDQGQVSKLLSRLRHLGLVENAVEPRIKGQPNGWRLTPRGEDVRNTISR